LGKVNNVKKKGGTGVSPVQSFKITRRTLPHWQEPGRVYFINWRCKKGEVLSPEERTITLEALNYWDGRKWTSYAAVIMPDHVHGLVQPLTLPQGAGVFDLAEIIHSVKSFSVHQINRQRGSRGLSGKMNAMTALSGMKMNFWRNGSIL
jgi:REP element-mobilizing transposase RayT